MTLTGLSAQFRATNKHKTKLLALTIAALFVGAFLIAGTAGVRINASPSLPIGLYVPTGNLAEPLVEFCPPEPYASLAIRRGYRTKGSCSDGGTPLLKPVIATEGDIVTVSDSGISVNGQVDSEHAPARSRYSGAANAVVAYDDPAGPARHNLGCIELQSTQFRQPVFRPNLHKFHSKQASAARN